MTENKEGDNNSKPEKKSPYDWEAFEFKICDKDMNRYILNGSSLMKSVLSYIDEHGDGNLTENEFSRYKNNPHVSFLLSKLIIAHRSAWAYSGDMLTNMIKEVEQFYDELIEQSNPQNSEKSQEIQKQRDEDLKRFEQKVKNLTFIDQLNLEGNSSLPAYCFYYFHPKAFVEQMKRMESCNKWHDPVDNPQLCLFTQNGYSNMYWGSFGEKIRNGNKHAGIDIFALPGTPVYACVDGTIAKVYTSGSLAGRVISLKVKDKTEFLSLKKHGFSPKYTKEGELMDKKFDEKADIYLVYMHLSEFLVKENQEVKCGDVIAKSGHSGANGVNFSTKNPHLHLEVSNNVSVGGIEKKCNPILFFNIKYGDELSETDKDKQKAAKEKGY